MGIDILGVDILGIDILGIDIVAPPRLHTLKILYASTKFWVITYTNVLQLFKIYL